MMYKINRFKDNSWTYFFVMLTITIVFSLIKDNVGLFTGNIIQYILVYATFSRLLYVYVGSDTDLYLFNGLFWIVLFTSFDVFFPNVSYVEHLKNIPVEEIAFSWASILIIFLLMKHFVEELLAVIFLMNAVIIELISIKLFSRSFYNMYFETNLIDFITIAVVLTLNSNTYEWRLGRNFIDRF